MKKLWLGSMVFFVLGISSACSQNTSKTPSTTLKNNPMDENKDSKAEKVVKTDAEWRKILSPEAYEVLRQKGTERPYSNEYDHFFEEGSYVCAGCQTLLFPSTAKYNSGCGWPAFYDAIDKSKITEIRDVSHGMVRIEVLCKTCDGHLGHIFPDGPKPTGVRYCINSVSIKFVPKKKE